jgi:anti-anti-sigma regulatory factor
MATASPALVFEAAEQGAVVMAQLAGVINEDNLLEERLTATKNKGVLIDLANVERINSCGVRDWIRFAQRLEAAGNNLYLLRCSPVVVAQLNMVRNFCGEKGQVLSFQAPYFCPKCDEERTETFPAAKVSVGVSPDAVCPTCQGPMEFDDLPDLYFAFAKIHGPRPVPQEIQSALENFRSRPSTPVSGPQPGGSRPATPAIQAPVAKPLAATPGLGPPKPAAPPAPLQAARSPAPAAPNHQSNPALRPVGSPVAPPAVPSQAARRPSSPTQQPPVGTGTGPGQARGTSGPKPPVAARPMMGGSPFPSSAARPSGPKPSMPMAAPGNGTTDPSKKP